MGFEPPTGYQRPLKTSVNTHNSQVTNPLGGVLGGVFRLFATSCRWSFFVIKDFVIELRERVEVEYKRIGKSFRYLIRILQWKIIITRYKY